MNKVSKKSKSSKKSITVSKKTLKEMDDSMANLEKGKAYGPITLK